MLSNKKRDAQTSRRGGAIGSGEMAVERRRKWPKISPLGEEEIAELPPKKHNGNKQKYRATNDNWYMKNVCETPGGRFTKFYAGRLQLLTL